MKTFEYPRQRRAIERAFDAAQPSNPKIERTVARVIQDVHKRGDAALLEYTSKFDKIVMARHEMRISADACRAAWDRLDANLARALRYAADGIRAFHERQLRKGFTMKRGGAVLEQRIRPIRRAGVYVPGGRAVYPSTMLMNVIPAQVAGVQEIYAVTPPIRGKAEDFVPFAVAHLLGLGGNVFQVGGAQAVAALAYGTDTIPRVDKVVGPGNVFVATAKRMLYGTIDIESVAGESEVLIIADASARADFIAADLLAQAEHTGGETVVLVGIGKKFDFEAVHKEVRRQLRGAPRAEQAKSSFINGGFFIRVENATQAIEVAEMKAPEHLEILAENAEEIANGINNVGAIFLGPFTPEPIGDYVAGPNHVLPTGGTARFFSPLGVDAFLKASNVLKFDIDSFLEAAPHVITLAESEQLFAHANAVRIRLGS